MNPFLLGDLEIAYRERMWIVVEFRRGDIAQTWGLFSNKNNAVNRMLHLMDMFDQCENSWWKLLEIHPEQPVNRNVPAYVVVRMNWEDENELEFVGIYDQMDLIPEDDRNDPYIWIDSLVLDA